MRQNIEARARSNKASSLVKGILAGVSLVALITHGGFSFAVELDVRAQAQQALASLHEVQIPSSNLSELESIKATMNIADDYQSEQMDEEAGIFYTLVIQKTQVLLQKAIVPPTPTAAIPDKPDVASISAPAASSSFAIRGLAGAMSVYTAEKGDTLRLIASKLGVSRQHLITINHLGKKTAVKVGQLLKYDNRRIIPKMIQKGIVINIPDRTLYYFQNGALVRTLPVALGTPTKSDDFNWQTPTGRFKIIEKIRNPTWTVPPSIQAQMESQGKEVITSIPPGPECPLGKFAIRTSIPGIMIHSTTKPGSINSYSSHGCIRVFPANMESFFKQIAVNTPGEIIYKPVKVTVGEAGRVFLEVHRDVYDKKINLATEARNLIEKRKLSDKVDWRKIKDIVKRQDGTIEDITL
ncbi:MAG: L,D-transpeptidase family protein [Oryzomonas sp.]|uniref:L,D-transpeptidase family protein n=1 Tax=Oryzomonas sp. TaxID=2855186 RepID=UPI00283C4837|nr:L,D-transpeptidase family protein [Oryzomonas sp.]MDR3579745.1 L,D-transpeptidase family protein [Oryzomonas sp.]